MPVCAVDIDSVLSSISMRSADRIFVPTVVPAHQKFVWHKDRVDSVSTKPHVYLTTQVAKL